jgi:hypothetical protein
MAGLSAADLDWSQAIRFADKVKRGNSSGNGPKVIEGDRQAAIVFVFLGAVLSYAAYSTSEFPGRPFAIAALLTASAGAFAISFFWRFRGMTFFSDHIHVKRIGSSTTYQYGDIAKVDWDVIIYRRSYIYGVTIVFRDGRDFEGKLDDQTAVSLAYARQRVEEAGGDISGWLPVPSEFERQGDGPGS